MTLFKVGLSVDAGPVQIKDVDAESYRVGLEPYPDGVLRFYRTVCGSDKPSETVAFADGIWLWVERIETGENCSVSAPTLRA